MHLYTSYFYQIRYFKPYMIPFSAAVVDPPWFHDFKDSKHNFIDKNGVLNGLRMKNFIPHSDFADICLGNQSCLTGNPRSCPYMTAYENQLRQLTKKKVEDYFESVCNQAIEKMGEELLPVPVLIVEWGPENVCSRGHTICTVMTEIGIPTSELKYPISANY